MSFDALFAPWLSILIFLPDVHRLPTAAAKFAREQDAHERPRRQDRSITPMSHARDAEWHPRTAIPRLKDARAPAAACAARKRYAQRAAVIVRSTRVAVDGSDQARTRYEEDESGVQSALRVLAQCSTRKSSAVCGAEGVGAGRGKCRGAEA